MDQAEYRIQKKLLAYNKELRYRKLIYHESKLMHDKTQNLRENLWNNHNVLQVKKENLAIFMSGSLASMAICRSIVIFPIS